MREKRDIMDASFSSLEELYNRLKPALRTKCSELKEYGYGYLNVDDVWNYLKDTRWVNGNNLSLSDMVSDILNAENELIDDYFKRKINEKNKKEYFDV